LVEVGVFHGVGDFKRKFQGKGDIAPNHCWYRKTKVFLLVYSEDRMILSSFIWIGYHHVTDRRNCHG